MSKRLAIVMGVTDVLKRISVANGFNTDIGGRAYFGEAGFSDQIDHLPFVSVIEDPAMVTESEEPQKPTIFAGTIKLIVQGYARDDTENPAHSAYLLLHDIQRVIAREQAKNGARGEFPPNLFGLGNVGRNLRCSNAGVFPTINDDGMSVRDVCTCVLSVWVDYAEDLAAT